MVHHYYDKAAENGAKSPFCSRGFLRDALIRCTDGTDVPIRNLPPFLRALLVTDGTVTKTLEAYFWEPVEVVALQQEFIHVEQSIAWIRLAPGDQVLTRRGLLRGLESKQIYARAFCIIRTQLIPETLRQRLIDRRAGAGIGVLIRDSSLESYREVLEVGIEPAGKSEDPTASKQSDLVFRTYRVIIDGEPVILITERFPLHRYQ